MDHPIPGTIKQYRLEETLAAAGLTLTSDELMRLADASSRIEIQDGRYPDFPEAQHRL
jgi:hypothetical protein